MIQSFRLRCFARHLMISVVIALFSIYLIFGMWYPKPFDKAVGVSDVILVMIAIDMILGPVLTLILAKEGKKGLMFDFVVIGIVQLLALAYGIYSIEKGRPMWVVFDLNRFELVQRYMLDEQKDAKADAMNAYQGFDALGITWASVRPAKTREEQDDWMFYELETGVSPAMRPALYAPLSENMDRVLAEKLPLSDLNQFNDKTAVDAVLLAYPLADGFLPMRTGNMDMAVLVSSQDKSFVQVVDLRPW